MGKKEDAINTATLKICGNKKWYQALWLKIAIILIVVLTGLSIVIVKVGKTDAEKVEHYLELGNKYLSELKYEKAVVQFEKVLEIEPKNIDAVCGLAEAYMGLDDEDAAKKVLQGYIDGLENSKFKLKQEAVYELLGEILYDEGEYEEVIRLVGHAVKRQDTDGDNLPDYYEKLHSLNWESEDSNGDGLTDSQPILEWLITDAILKDESYLYADADEDGLINLEELELGTNPFCEDTDGDLLTDYEEVYLYDTSPVVRDTDGDTLYDGTEVLADLDPLLKDSDGDGISDGENVFSRVVFMPSAQATDDKIYPIAWVEGVGEYYGKFDAVSVGENSTISGIGSKLGDPFEFTVPAGNRNGMQIGFCIPSQTDFYCSDSNDIRIATYNYDDNQLQFCETEIFRFEDDSAVALTDVVENGTYLLINYDRFKNDISISEESSLITSGKADIVFVLDITGSMGGPIANVKQNMVSFTEYMNNQGVDCRFGLVCYKDIYEDGIESTLDKGFYYSYDEFLDVLYDIDSMITGGGDDAETVVDALYTMHQMGFRAGVSKFAIVLTDATYKNGIRTDSTYTLEQVTEDLRFHNICTSVVTNGSFFSEYDSLTERTGGELCYINGDFMNELTPLMNKIGTVVQEGCWIRLSNGCVVNLKEDPATGSLVDTDSDGIPDKEELGEIITVTYIEDSGEVLSYHAYTFRSNPALADSDGDGYSDAIDIRPLKYDVIYVTGNNSGYSEILQLPKQIQGEYSYSTENFSDMFNETKGLKKLFVRAYGKLKGPEDRYILGEDVAHGIYDIMRYTETNALFYMPLELFSNVDVEQRICNSLDNRLPVLLQCGIAGGINLYEDEALKNSSEKVNGGEWLEVCAYCKDNISGITWLKVKYNNQEFYIDFCRVMDNNFMGTLVGLR